MSDTEEKAEVIPELDVVEDAARGVKRPAPESKEQDDLKVSSANDWEHADLGDKGRKNKFLRLMGASKKEHHGKFVIGDKQRAEDRAAEKTGKLCGDLEHQYEHSLAHKLQGGPRGHIGLGFHDDEKKPETTETPQLNESSEADSNVKSEASSEIPDTSKQSESEQSLPDSSTVTKSTNIKPSSTMTKATNIKPMNFVRSSDS